MIKEIKRKYWLWRNHKWIQEHEHELYEKYDGRKVIVDRCKIIYIGNYFDNFPYSEWHGEIEYDIPVNLDKLAAKHGFIRGAHKTNE